MRIGIDRPHRVKNIGCPSFAIANLHRLFGKRKNLKKKDHKKSIKYKVYRYISLFLGGIKDWGVFGI